MNCFYNQEDARLWLNSFIAQTSQDGDPIGTISELDLSRTTIVQQDKPSCFCLCFEEGEGQISEVMVRIAGILCSKTLPPITRPLRANTPKHIRHLRQFIRLTGLGSLSFEGAVYKIQEIIKLFEAAIRPKTLHSVECSEYEGDGAVDLHTRYFTERRYGSHARHIPFTSDVDPLHILEEIRGTDFVHGDENEVEYLWKVIEENLFVRHDAIPPSSFKEGDIVEATAVFVCYPVGPEDMKLVINLRALSLINDTMQKEAETERERSKAL